VRSATEAARNGVGSGVFRVARSRQVDDPPDGVLRIERIAAPDFDVAQHDLQAGLVVEAGRARLAVLGLELVKQLALVERQLLRDCRQPVEQAVHLNIVDQLTDLRSSLLAGPRGRSNPRSCVRPCGG
jgi:hypothetical protein